MSTEIAVREEGRQMAVLTNEQLQFIASTEFVPPGLRGNLPAILACVATGRALGIADMSALRSIHIIDGKATFSAELMVQLVRRAGHSIVGEVTDGSATVTGTRADNGDTMSSTWTLAMAERAGLLKKQNWVKYPEAMLWARAASQLCRMLFADCFAGATYTPEELEEPRPFDPEREQGRLLDELEDVEVSAGDPQTESSPPSAPVQADASTSSQPSPAEKLATAAQKKKLDVLVGQLRDGRHLTNADLYTAMKVDPDPYRDEAGIPHWSTLRDLLSREQASDLIGRLEKYAAAIAEATAA